MPHQMKWASNLTQAVIFGAIKLSVIFFYRQIFRGKIFDLCSKSLMVIVGAWTIAFFFTVFFERGTSFWAL